MQQPVRAYIFGSVLSIDFTSSQPAATITIENKLTGEVVYTEVCNVQSTSIDMSMYATDDGDTYIIDIKTASWERTGEFCL